MPVQLPLPLKTDLRLVDLRDTLLSNYGPQRDDERHDPESQFVKAMLSSETRDATSARVFEELRNIHSSWDALRDCCPDTLLAQIQDVTHAELKTKQLIGSIQTVIRLRGRFELSFLADWPVDAAMTWLQYLPGVGPKIAGATLNFSDLRKRVIVVDRHVLRISQRAGLVPHIATTARALSILMRMVPIDWNADDLYELHWLMKMQSQRTCHLFDPDCHACPLLPQCDFARSSTKRPKLTFLKRPLPSARADEPILI